MVAEKNGFVIWITGLPASGKSSLAIALQTHLRELQIEALVLDANDLRPVLTPEPNYTDSERRWFYSVLTYMATWLAQNGQNVIIAATGNRRTYRQKARTQIPLFAEVYVTTPLDVCQERDGNGQYGMVAAVDEDHLPGIGVPYEPPPAPEAEANLVQNLPSVVAESIVRRLQMQQIIPVGVDGQMPVAA
jgi:adenylylsulfate kinase